MALRNEARGGHGFHRIPKTAQGVHEAYEITIEIDTINEWKAKRWLLEY